ncbi:MAG TPA: aminoglycoside phosphotransferase family protein [Jiangellaceae bacterium]|nr:aminoglycoside phosphotransferase family protein [Jiangellaceae bacterium]
MAKQRIEVPESFRATRRWQREGRAGARWLRSLPDLVASLCMQWDLVVDGSPGHGDNALIVPVRSGGEPLMLKVSWPDESVAEQAGALRLWDGEGTVRLVDADIDAGALLLERLDDSFTLSHLPIEHAVFLIGRILHRLARPAPSGYRTTADAAAELRASLHDRWMAVGRPFARRTLDAAVDLARELSAGAPRILVDRDLDYGQVLRADREPWLVIDPLVIVGDPEYLCGQLLWTRFDELGSDRTVRWCLDALTDAAELDREKAAAWSVLRAVDYWLWGLAAGFTEEPLRCQRIVWTLL